MDLAEKLNRKISFLENVAMGIAVASMLFIMVTVSLDTFLRYVFNNPFQWSYDVISLYALVFVSYLPISATFRDGAHVSVSLFVDLFSPRTMSAIRILVSAAILALAVFLFYISVASTLKSYLGGEVRLGIVMFVLWPSYLPIAIGFCIILARLLLNAWMLISLGRDPFVIQDGEMIE